MTQHLGGYHPRAIAAEARGARRPAHGV